MAIYGNVSAEGGFDQAEIDFVTNLISSGQVTPEQVSAQFGVPVDVINSVYAENVARLPSPAPAPVAPVAAAPTVLTTAPAPTLTETQEQTNDSGLLSTILKANNVLNTGVQAVDALKQFNVLKNTPAVASTAATTLEEIAANNPWMIQNITDAGSDTVQVLTEAQKASQMQNAADVFAGNLGSIVGAVSGQESPAETAALAALGFLNPATAPFALAYRLFDAMDLFGGGGLKATPMTPEEAAKYQGEAGLDQAVAQFAQGGEGAGEMVLDAIRRAEAANVTPEQIAETLNSRGSLVADLIGLTVGNNQPFVTDTAAASGGDTAADTTAVDDTLTTDSTAPDYSGLETLTGGSVSDAAANVVQGPIQDTTALRESLQAATDDVLETWTYNADTDSFVSNTRGDSIPRTGDPDVELKDGGEYTVRGVIGTEGVTAEHVVDADTGKSVGEFTIDVLTGLPTLNKLPTGAATSAENTTGAADGDVNIVGSVGNADTASVDDGGGVTLTGGSLDGESVVVKPTATPTVTPTPTPTPTPTVINGVDGKDGKDGGQGVAGADGVDGRDGTDGRDGRDGLTGLLTLNSIATPLADRIFTNEFKMDYLKPEFIGLLDLTRGRTV